jgi:hypothetical protein
MININPSEAFVVQIVEKGSKYDTPRVNVSNELIMLTCSEYLVFDTRCASERMRIPSQKIAEQMYEKTMCKLGEKVDELIEKRDIVSLNNMLLTLAPNRHTARINAFLRAVGGHNVKQTKIEI